jgi:DNA-binding response OmpR family regulator
MVAGKRILIVDDESDVQELVRLVLEMSGYVVSSAGNGKEALEKIQALRPDLVVLDLMMPGLDGWGVLENLRRTADPPPVVILSAIARVRTQPPGAVGFVAKPFEIKELLRTCAHALVA